MDGSDCLEATWDRWGEVVGTCVDGLAVVCACVEGLAVSAGMTTGLLVISSGVIGDAMAATVATTGNGSGV